MEEEEMGEIKKRQRKWRMEIYKGEEKEESGKEEEVRMEKKGINRSTTIRGRGGKRGRRSRMVCMENCREEGLVEVPVKNLGEIKSEVGVGEFSEAGMNEYIDKNGGGGWPRTATGQP